MPFPDRKAVYIKRAQYTFKGDSLYSMAEKSEWVFQDESKFSVPVIDESTVKWIKENKYVMTTFYQMGYRAYSETYYTFNKSHRIDTIEYKFYEREELVEHTVCKNVFSKNLLVKSKCKNVKSNEETVDYFYYQSFDKMHNIVERFLSKSKKGKPEHFFVSTVEYY
jgi:hypothetical protein